MENEESPKVIKLDMHSPRKLATRADSAKAKSPSAMNLDLLDFCGTDTYDLDRLTEFANVRSASTARAGSRRSPDMSPWRRS
jgi:hypothetical protein